MSDYKYTTPAEDVKRDELANLLAQIRELTGRDVTLADYFRPLPDGKAPCMAAENLRAELKALRLIEDRHPGWAQYSVTMRDKLLLYLEAIQRIENWDTKLLDAPCTWQHWKNTIAAEVMKGRPNGN